MEQAPPYYRTHHPEIPLFRPITATVARLWKAYRLRRARRPKVRVLPLSDAELNRPPRAGERRIVMNGRLLVITTPRCEEG